MQRHSTIRRLITFGAVVLTGLVTFTGVAAATPAREAPGGADPRGNPDHASSTKDCDGTHHSTTGHGANDADPHAYVETCDGSPSGNGGGGGEAEGSPCAGCVGNADDKNPPGQSPDGPTDHNAGYECDRNHGVGRTNPAHTGCTPAPAGSSDDDDTRGGHAGGGTGRGHGGNGASASGPDGAGPPACPAGDVPSCALQVDPVVPARRVPGAADGGSAPVEVSASGSQDDATGPLTMVGPAVNASAGEGDGLPAAHVATGPAGRAAVAAAPARPAEVLGVQLRRAGSTPLARTGGPATVPLASLGALLCLLGLGLTSVRSRRDATPQVAAAPAVS